MVHDEFIRGLADEGFEEVVTVKREADGSLDTHSHPFEAKALVLEGELRIRTADAERLYKPGDIFHLQADVPHSERYGPEGVTYLVGRKQKSEVGSSCENTVLQSRSSSPHERM